MCSVFVSAITSTLLTGAVYLNIDKVPTTIEKSIGVVNSNNYTVNVFLDPNDDIKEIITLEENNLTLEPEEQKFVKFNISLNEAKNYESSISAIFSKTDVPKNMTADQVGMSMKLIINAEDAEIENGNVEENNSKIMIYAFAALGIIIIATAIIFVIIKFKPLKVKKK